MRAPVLCAVSLCLLGYNTVMAEESGLKPSRGDVTVIGGYNDVDSGFDDRGFLTSFANAYSDSGIGYHAEVTGETREETAAFFAAGLSYNTPSVSARGMLGSSTDNEDILPQFYARGEVAYRTDPALGIVVTPSITYREFRNGVEEFNTGGNLTKYFALGEDRQLITQLYGNAIFVDPGDEFGGFGGTDVTYGRYRRWSIGSTFEAGVSNFESVLGAGEVNNAFYSVRPHASIYVTDTVELIGLVSYYDTEEFNIIGGGVGVKFELGGAPR